MTSDVQRRSPVKFILSIIGLTALVMLTTGIISFLVTSPPRGFMFWVSTGFLYTVEFLVGILWVNTFARASCEYRPSGAVLAITYSIVGAFAASGLLSIIVYWVFRDANGSKDDVFTAILMGITVFWFAIAFLLYAYDLYTQARERPAMAKRAEHREYARSLKPILAAIRSVKPADDEHRNRLALLAKKIETLDGSLSHSHGGGIGSWEAGRSHQLSPEHEQAIQQSILSIEGVIPRLGNGSGPDFASAISEIEQSVARISIAVDALGLL